MLTAKLRTAEVIRERESDTLAALGAAGAAAGQQRSGSGHEGGVQCWSVRRTLRLRQALQVREQRLQERRQQRHDLRGGESR